MFGKVTSSSKGTRVKAPILEYVWHFPSTFADSLCTVMLPHSPLELTSSFFCSFLGYILHVVLPFTLSLWHCRSNCSIRMLIKQIVKKWLCWQSRTCACVRNTMILRNHGSALWSMALLGHGRIFFSNHPGYFLILCIFLFYLIFFDKKNQNSK